MSDFEGLFGLFALMFGLIVAEVAIKFADAIDSNRERPMGILTPALAFLVLTDVTSFWIFIWSARNVLRVNWHTVFISVLVAIVYFLAATLVFPRKDRGWTHLDDHYWSRKRLVAGGILLANAVVAGMLLARAFPAWNDWLFYFYFVSYYVAIAGLVVSRSRRLDYVLLAWAISVNLLAGLSPLPNSEWGKTVGLSFSAEQHVAKPR